MNKLRSTFPSLILVIAFIAYLGSAAANPEATYTTPRTWHDQPDLQGVWYFGSTTPFTRPTELGEQAVYSPEEARAIEEKALQSKLSQEAPLDPDRAAPELGAFVGFEADFNFARLRHEMQAVQGEYRTSLIVQPANGQLPSREGFKDFHAKRRESGVEAYDGPEAQDAGERCLTGGMPVPSLYPSPWNANMQIVQNQDYVMIQTEMIHDARIIKLSGSHLGDHMMYWYGDAIGYYEGDTLVVHSKNFRAEHSNFLMRSSEKLEVTERFTRVGEDEIFYQVIVDDPLAHTEPFVVERTISRRPHNEPIYEFACHEGNYSMKWVLTGARRAEVDSALNGDGSPESD
jgi:hypothetical protein